MSSGLAKNDGVPVDDSVAVGKQLYPDAGREGRGGILKLLSDGKDVGLQAFFGLLPLYRHKNATSPDLAVPMPCL